MSEWMRKANRPILCDRCHHFYLKENMWALSRGAGNGFTGRALSSIDHKVWHVLPVLVVCSGCLKEDEREERNE
jgi:hypothetical protein